MLYKHRYIIYERNIYKKWTYSKKNTKYNKDYTHDKQCAVIY